MVMKYGSGSIALIKGNKMDNKRKVFLVDDNGKEIKINFCEIKKGMTINLYESDDGSLVFGKSIVALSDSYSQKDEPDNWGFEVNLKE